MVIYSVLCVYGPMKLGSEVLKPYRELVLMTEVYVIIECMAYINFIFKCIS